MTASAAYVAAGYKANDGNASRLKGNESVRARIDEILAEGAAKVGVTVEAVVRELAKIGFANIADYVDVSGPDPVISLSGVSQDKLAALQEITTEVVHESRGRSKADEVRRVKIKLWDKKSALVDLGKHLGMFKDPDLNATINISIAGSDAEL